MKFRLTILSGLAGLVAVLGAFASVSRAVEARPGSARTPERLRMLAGRAIRKSEWAPLRRYAKSVRDPEQQGRAWFALGYREYQGGDLVAAEDDLRRAAATRFSLADFATYYQARATLEGGNGGAAAASLDGFAARFAGSVLGRDALETQASAWLDAREPQKAIQALEAGPGLNDQPPLLLLLAQAYRDAGQLTRAAQAFECVYFGFPNSRESAAAGESLARLQSELGSAYPAPAVATVEARADDLSHTGRFAEAITEYEGLLRQYPADESASSWNLARARCLLGLKRYHDAVDSLSSTSPPAGPELGAARLAVLVNAYAGLDDEAGMLGAFDELAKLYPQSPDYASALSRVAYQFFLHGDWSRAAENYGALATLPASTDLVETARWRVAWTDYLQGKAAEAQQAMLNYVRRYPVGPRVPAALYWLGRLSEASGATPEAPALYALLADRFPNGYYTEQAARRLGASKARAPGGSASGPASELAALIPARPAASQARLHPPRAIPSYVEPFGTLRDLSLDDLARGYLKAELSLRPSDSALLLALARLESEAKNYSAALFTTRKLAPDFARYRLPEMPKAVWNQLYPVAYWKIVRRQARRWRLDPYLVMALIRQESAFDAAALSPAGARGLMQVRPPTAEALARVRRRRPARTRLDRELDNPEYNIGAGCRYLSELMQMFDLSTEESLAAYNAGDDRVRAWLGHGPFPEPAAFVESIPYAATRAYVESAMRDAAIYRRLLS